MSLDHAAQVVSFKGYDTDAYGPQSISGPDDPQFGKRVLCEGDSWFSLGAIPSSNLLFPLQFRQKTLLMNLATPGDTLLNMTNPSTNAPLKRTLAETQWDAIFVSGGGNDLIDNIFNVICEPSVGAGQHFLDYIDRIELAGIRANIQRYHRQLAQLRDSGKNAGVPIVTHVYDYPTPRNAKANIVGFSLKGPWLYPALMTAKVPEAFWISIADYIFESLAATLVELSALIDNFHVIAKTKGTLVRARLGTTGNDGDWLNEIHPNAGGYKKLAEVISPELDALLFPS
ncbi:SGNH/GDSL hydrolase family protein [Variovorax ginsengisoli]|uniref:Lysophospholipase L1-like esterase n=1 Tax=Variovorax ginsengisoli TaxID=363844 RepID=A0ABT9SF93_9BURK|nr:SGNH/GDSL hydrolase family protein [Variovorax ginsengisoli]MDP9903038.1 lysophospholipase L1-like esterase [Variovorax ginsengisoli]